MVAASGCAPPMPPKPGGQDPAPAQIAAEVLAAHLDEGLVGALHDALAADVDPRAGRHLAEHHQALAVELVEVLPVGPVRHQVGVGDAAPAAHPRACETPRPACPTGSAASRSASSARSAGNDRVVALPVARRLADAAVDHQVLGPLGHLRDRGCSSACAAALRSATSGPRAACRAAARITLPRATFWKSFGMFIHLAMVSFNALRSGSFSRSSALR